MTILPFVCLCFDCIWYFLVKQENYSIQSKLVRLHFTAYTVFIETIRHYTVMASDIRNYTMLILNKDDLEFLTEFPCL